MNARMEDYTLLRPAEAKNAWQEAVKQWQAAGTIRAALSTAGGNLQAVNELLRVESTHTAVTDAEVLPGDRLRAGDGALYDVTYVIAGTARRYAQLFLKAVTGP